MTFGKRLTSDALSVMHEIVLNSYKEQQNFTFTILNLKIDNINHLWHSNEHGGRPTRWSTYQWIPAWRTMENIQNLLFGTEMEKDSIPETSLKCELTNTKSLSLTSLFLLCPSSPSLSLFHTSICSVYDLLLSCAGCAVVDDWRTSPFFKMQESKPMKTASHSSFTFRFMNN